MYDFWYDYIKQKYWNKTILSYMDTDRFITYVKTEDVHEDIADDVEKVLIIKLWSLLTFAYRKKQKKW